MQYSFLQYGFLLALIYSVWVTILFIRRDKEQGNSPSVLGVMVTCGFLMVIATLFFPFVFIEGKMLYEYASKPKYEAQIVAYRAYKDTCERKVSSGRNNQRTERYACTKYASTVSFVDDKKHPHQLDTNIASGEEPVIGESITVMFNEGDEKVGEFSTRSLFLSAGLALMLLLLGALLWYIFRYAQKKPAPTLSK